MSGAQYTCYYHSGQVMILKFAENVERRDCLPNYINFKIDLTVDFTSTLEPASSKYQNRIIEEMKSDTYSFSLHFFTMRLFYNQAFATLCPNGMFLQVF